MHFWKALLLVSFLVYAVHCEESEEVKDAVEETSKDVEDEQEATMLSEQEESDEDEDQLQDEQEQDPAGAYKQLVSQKKVIVYANKNVGQCSKTSQKLNCWVKRQCLAYHGYGYKKRCVKVLVSTFCNFQITETCKFCTKYYLKRCYKIHYGIKCYRSSNKLSCARKVNRQYKVTKLVNKQIINKW